MRTLPLVPLCGLLALFAAAELKADVLAQLKQADVQQGICVLLSDAPLRDAESIANNTKLTTLVQVADRQKLEEIRAAFAKTGLLNRRVYVEQGSATELPLADNLANAVIVSEAGADRKELLRVLVPGGKLIVGDETSTKPVPDDSDTWSHPYHGPDNNPLSQDRRARAPYLTQFLATPWYGPMPEVTVVAGGRLFKAFGHLAFKEREWPMLSKLIAMDAYNGTRLWERKLQPGFMIHRNTLIATDDTLYLADNNSCKEIDAATGKLRDEIVIEGLGPSWKWMALDDGVLYALLGEKEKVHEVHRGTRTQTGWPWQTVRKTYGEYLPSWGYGTVLAAIDPKTKKVLWKHQADKPIDSRAVCMNGNRIFLYSHQQSLTAIERSTGKPLWKTTDTKLLAAVGKHDPAQHWQKGYATSAYAKCNEQAVYFAGPQRTKLVAVSAQDGELLWTHDDGNMQLVLRPDGLYAMGRLSTSKKFDYLTGKVLAELQCFRGNCTRATGTIDSIFARGYRHTGTMRFDVNAEKPQRLPAMRPACQDGVVVAGGLLYWGPWMCDCNHSLVGVISLGTAGTFDFGEAATTPQRRTVFAQQAAKFPAETDRDWPTYRGDNQRSASSPVNVPAKVSQLWEHAPSAARKPTAPVAAGGLVLISGSDGLVTALEAASGKIRWQWAAGGAVQYPPTISAGKVYVGAADGYVHCLAAATGKPLWQFRAAPRLRKIPVYGRLSSTWPVASGVMIEDGVAYAAAGITSLDGTHVYAIDADAGDVHWHNGTSGSLLGKDEVVGVHVQGHLLFHDGKVHLAGGNVVSPATYDATTGKCLNQIENRSEKTLDDHWQKHRASRGSELFLVQGRVVTGGRMLYAPPKRGPNSRYESRHIVRAARGDVIIEGSETWLRRVSPPAQPDEKPRVHWKVDAFAHLHAVALAGNAVVVTADRKTDGATGVQSVVVALDPEKGSELWHHKLPGEPTAWGLAIDRAGRLLVTLTDGRVVCLGQK